MNRQRKVMITITYNELGIIIDTKAEEAAQPNLQPTCNKLATDCISRHAVSAWLDNIGHPEFADVVMDENRFPSAQPEIIRCKDCGHWDTTWQNDLTPNYHYCSLVEGTRSGDFYCADAERRR